MNTPILEGNVHPEQAIERSRDGTTTVCGLLSMIVRVTAATCVVFLADALTAGSLAFVGGSDTRAIAAESEAASAAQAGGRRGARPRVVVNAIGMEFVEIPAGDFLMGSSEDGEEITRAFAGHGRTPEEFADELPRHRVRITKPFLLGRHEVTVGDFRRFVEATGYRTEPERDGAGAWGYDPEAGRCVGSDRRFSWRDPGFPQTPRHPVLNVTWNDAVAFCEWLSKLEGRPCRLPTEAEWEYACRGGSTGRFAFGDDPSSLAKVARTLDPAGRNLRLHVQDVPIEAAGPLPFTVPAGSYAANAFGLHDMHGNVWEWVADWYGEDTYGRGATDDPAGPDRGIRRVRRGGGWNSFPLWARSSFRDWKEPDGRCVNLGFRVAADARMPRAVSRQGTVAIQFVGDIMLDNGPGHAIASGRDPFAACEPLLMDADFTIGNLECVLGRKGDRVLKAYTFRAAIDAERRLKPWFSAVSVANNHALDFGPEGLVETLAILAREGIPQIGGGQTIEECRKPLVLEKDGVRVAILAANEFRAEGYAPTGAAAGVNPLREEDLLADIREASRTADAVIPFVHWGPENTPEPGESQRRLARRMVEAGASAVIGAHPHVTQTVDVHRGAPIIYSLGNFVFDYYPVDPPVWHGWTVKLSITRGKPIDVETRTVELDKEGLPFPLREE
jgi:sulfatase modifying factor 1